MSPRGGLLILSPQKGGLFGGRGLNRERGLNRGRGGGGLNSGRGAYLIFQVKVRKISQVGYLEDGLVCTKNVFIVRKGNSSNQDS